MTSPTENNVLFLLTNLSDSDNVRHVTDISKAAAILGRLGGKAKSAKKAAAVRANGKLGGRPPKKKSRSTAA